MSTRKSPNKINYPFDEVWSRIKSVTPLKKQNELSEIVGTSQSNISKRSSENIFPPEWAFRIAQKYLLNTDWLMTGEGTKLRGTSDPSYQNKILHDIDIWLTETINNDPNRKGWFICAFLDAFPIFNKWKENQNNVKNKYNTPSNSKAA